MQNTPFDEALNLVVRAAGLGYERVGNSILVADPARLQTRTGLTTRIFTLEYADPVRVAEALAVISENVTVDAVRHQVLIRESQSLVEQAAAIIEELDRKPGQVLLRARLIEVNASALRELGIDWEQITKWSTVLTEGDHGASRPRELPEDLGYIQADHVANYYRQAAAFEVALDALLTDGDARLLSDSKVTTLDNEPAEIFVGETVPVVVTSLGSAGPAGGAFQTIQLEKIDVGVKLSITPRISSEGYITTIVAPEVSSIVAFVGPDDDLPQTAMRRALTTVRVRDGQKIYLGGLLSKSRRTVVKKVPILGSIPLLGLLFQHHRDETLRNDLVIEVTPTVVSDEGTTDSNSIEER